MGGLLARHDSSESASRNPVENGTPPPITRRLETFATLIAAGVTLFEVRSHWPNNFLIYRTATENLLRGSDLYVAYPERHFDLFKYSPTFALAFWPFAVAPTLLSLLLWNSASAWCFARTLRAVIPDTIGQVFAGLMLLWPFVAQVSGAQTNALIAALMIAGVIAMENYRPQASALAITSGAMMKLFPLAAMPLLLTQPRRLRFLVTTVLSAVLLIVSPLVVVTPHVLLQEYRSWYRVESVDALDRGYSVMGVLHDWFNLDWPNWPIQLVGTAILLLPLLLRRPRLTELAFRRQMLASILFYVVLFNHQAEYQSYLISATGFVIWFLWSPRTVPRAVATALAMFALHPVPYFFAWSALQVELMRPTRRVHSNVADTDVDSRYDRSEEL